MAPAHAAVGVVRLTSKGPGFGGGAVLWIHAAASAPPSRSRRHSASCYSQYLDLKIGNAGHFGSSYRLKQYCTTTGSSCLSISLEAVKVYAIY